MSPSLRHRFHQKIIGIVNAAIVLIGIGILMADKSSLMSKTLIDFACLLVCFSAVTSLTILIRKRAEGIASSLMLFNLLGVAFAMILFLGGFDGLFLYALPLFVLLVAILSSYRETVVFSVCLALVSMVAISIENDAATAPPDVVTHLSIWSMALFAMALIHLIENQHRFLTDKLLAQIQTNQKIQWIYECEARYADQLFQLLSSNIRSEQHVFAKYVSDISMNNPDHDLAKPVALMHDQMRQLANYVDTEQSLSVNTSPVSMRSVRHSLESLFGQSQLNAAVQVKLNVNCDENDRIDIDLPRLEQVWINLFNNSIRFTERGEIRIDVMKEDGRYRFHFFDSGCGIPPAEKKRIFSLFEQGRSNASAEGLGIGLALSSNILNQLGSRLFLKSHLGRGSLFWFFIDIYAEDGAS